MQMIAGIRPITDWDLMMDAVNAAGDLTVVINNHNNAPYLLNALVIYKIKD
jgi:hypothetical protein